MLKKLGAVCLAAVLLLTGCMLRPQENGSKVQSISRPAVESAELQFTHPAAGDTVAVFDTSAGVFRAVLFPEKAPQACDNFIGLVQQGYYNGLTVVRTELTCTTLMAASCLRSTGSSSTLAIFPPRRASASSGVR